MDKTSLEIIEAGAADTAISPAGAVEVLHQAVAARRREVLDGQCQAALDRGDVAEYARLLNDAGAAVLVKVD